MSRYNYDRLSAQDASFLVFESSNVPMHIAATQIYNSGPLANDDGGVDFPTIRRAIEGVLHLIPRYRQKLKWIPFASLPVWVDDRNFSIDFHVRHTSLPRPGDEAQLKRLSARIMSQQLDRARPLWEIWVIEGLDDGRFAMVTKMHHCMIDGESGSDLAQILMSPDPNHGIEQDVPPFIPRPVPSATELLSDEAIRRATLPLKAFRDFRTFTRETQDLREEIEIRAKALANLAGYAVSKSPETPMNGPLGPHRRFDWLSMPLEDVKLLRRALDCTVNDIVLAIVTGAVRDFLIRRLTRPEEIDFRVSAPVSVRRDEDKGRMGNKVSSWIVSLPVGEADPVKQLEHIRHLTERLKSSQQALGVEMMMAMAELTPGVLLSLGARAASGPINMIATNVPGPQFPLYFIGAELLESYPQVPLLENTGLGVAIFSYNGSLCWGFNADYGLIPDLEAFIKGVQQSFEVLRAAAGINEEPADVHELHPEQRRSPDAV
jgi:diacylglycerol O-acyltransferase